MPINKIHQQKIEQLLSSLGLNHSEIVVYMTSLQLGPSTIIHLAQHAGLKRVTVHAIVDSLLQSELMLDTYRGKKRLVYTNTTQSLHNIVEKRKLALQQIEKQIFATEYIFDQITSLAENFPGVRMFQGIDGINTMLTETAQDKKDVMVINDAHSFNTLIDERLLQWSYQKRAENKIKTKMIYPNGFTDFRHIQRPQNYDIHIKTLPPNQIVDGGVTIRGSKVSLHCYKQGFVTTTILENREIANIMKMMYGAMWQTATDYQGSYVII